MRLMLDLLMAGNGIYLDYASTTFTRAEVVKEMQPYFTEKFGNPSSLHAMGKEARAAVEMSREKIRKILNAEVADSLIFTSTGTESINLAILGVARALKGKGKHIVTSTIEHKAVLETCKYLADKEGYRISYVSVGKNGLINPEDVARVITEETILVSIMYANNEIGTIQPIAEIGSLVRAKKVYFHTDACQAASFLNLDVKMLNVDLMTINSGKIYGPKGVGLLYARENLSLLPLSYGGGQEEGLRSGTENVPGIVGFARALELVQDEREKEGKRLMGLRDKLIRGLLEKVPNCKLNGDAAMRLANNVNITFFGVEGEVLLQYLNNAGIYVSSGSACTAYSIKASHVLIALGLNEKDAMGSVRFTLGKKTTEKDIEKVLEVVPGIVESLRKV